MNSGRPKIRGLAGEVADFGGRDGWYVRAVDHHGENDWRREGGESHARFPASELEAESLILAVIGSKRARAARELSRAARARTPGRWNTKEMLYITKELLQHTKEMLHITKELMICSKS